MEEAKIRVCIKISSKSSLVVVVSGSWLVNAVASADIAYGIGECGE